MSKQKKYTCMICQKNEVYCTVASNGDGAGESGFGPNRPVCKDSECRKKAKEKFEAHDQKVKEKEEKEQKLREIEREIEEKERKIREIEEEKENQRKDEQSTTYSDDQPIYSHGSCANCSRELPNKHFSSKINANWKFCSKNCGAVFHKKRACAECSNIIISRYYEKDNKKFCTDLCLEKYYAEVCDACGKKILVGDAYYNDVKNKTGTLCFACDFKKREQERKAELLKEELKKIENQSKEGKTDFGHTPNNLSENSSTSTDFEFNNYRTNRHLNQHRLIYLLTLLIIGIGMFLIIRKIRNKRRNKN